MILHARKCTFHPLPHQYWRGLRPFMQLHEKRHMKRAGEAGEVLRAQRDNSTYYSKISKNFETDIQKNETGLSRAGVRHSQ
jgi:hypothetical protein